jgi:ArsR family transcriptional regulator
MSNFETIQQQAEAFKALSNPHRLALFHRLMTCCVPGTVCDAEQAARLCVGELGEGLEIAPSTLSHHLKELNRAGLIRMERQGKNIHCWVEPAVLKTMTEFFNAC